ncbi:MAG: hypothetical protein ACP5N3_02165 [Candidatus Nanoarchaeia archaeon]
MNKNYAKNNYEPKLSNELRSFMEKQGTLKKFMDDYKHLCTNFMPAKIYVPGKEDKPENYAELNQEKRQVLDKLGKSYAHALHNLLELGLKMHKTQKKYAVIGGMGVLGHLFEHNPRFAIKWRGTDDIDILAKDDLSDLYKNMDLVKFNGQEKIDTSMIPDGRLYTYFKDNPWVDKAVKIQQRKTMSFPGRPGKDSSEVVLNNAKIVSLYGVPIAVASKEHLIESKTGIRTRKDKMGHLKDVHDAEHLQSVMRLEELFKEK